MVMVASAASALPLRKMSTERTPASTARQVAAQRKALPALCVVVFMTFPPTKLADALGGMGQTPHARLAHT